MCCFEFCFAIDVSYIWALSYIIGFGADLWFMFMFFKDMVIFKEFLLEMSFCYVFLFLDDESLFDTFINEK